MIMRSFTAGVFRFLFNCAPWGKYLVDALPLSNIMTEQPQYGELICEPPAKALLSLLKTKTPEKSMITINQATIGKPNSKCRITFQFLV